MNAADLAAIADQNDRAAFGLPHTGKPREGMSCEGVCRRCYLEARSDLYGRAADAARELEERA